MLKNIHLDSSRKNRPDILLTKGTFMKKIFILSFLLSLQTYAFSDRDLDQQCSDLRSLESEELKVGFLPCLSTSLNLTSPYQKNATICSMRLHPSLWDKKRSNKIFSITKTTNEGFNRGIIIGRGFLLFNTSEDELAGTYTYENQGCLGQSFEFPIAGGLEVLAASQKMNNRYCKKIILTTLSVGFSVNLATQDSIIVKDVTNSYSVTLTNILRKCGINN